MALHSGARPRNAAHSKGEARLGDATHSKGEALRCSAGQSKGNAQQSLAWHRGSFSERSKMIAWAIAVFLIGLICLVLADVLE